VRIALVANRASGGRTDPAPFAAALKAELFGIDALDGVLRGPEKYRILELKRRRAQIRARRELGLVD